MQIKQIKSTSSFRLFIAAFFVAGLAGASAPTQDNSQNGLLKGSYRFRHVAVLNVDSNFDPSEIAASYGTITFDGRAVILSPGLRWTTQFPTERRLR